MARRCFWAEKLRMPVHSAPSRPFATCSVHDHSSGSDFRSQYAMTTPFSCLQYWESAPEGRRHTIADLAAFVARIGRTHNPNAVGSNPSSATRDDEGSTDAGAATGLCAAVEHA